MKRQALVISNGPSGELAARFDLARQKAVIGVGGRATQYPCTHWVVRDTQAFVEWHTAVIGSPVLVASRNVCAPDLHGPEAAGMLKRWPHGTVWLDDLDVPAPPGKPKWFQWSGVAALGFAATLPDVERIVVVGADMGGDGGGPTIGDNTDRSAERWRMERVVWDWNSRNISRRGIEVVRMFPVEAVTGGA